MTSLRSSTHTLKPARARYAGAPRPFAPAPTTTASYIIAQSPLEHLARGIPPGRTHHAAAGVCRRTAQIQILDGGSVLRVSRHRPEHEQLMQRHRALENIP